MRTGMGFQMAGPGLVSVTRPQQRRGAAPRRGRLYRSGQGLPELSSVLPRRRAALLSGIGGGCFRDFLKLAKLWRQMRRHLRGKLVT